MKHVICWTAMSLALTACQSDNPPLTGTPPPPQKPIVRETVAVEGEKTQVFDPKVDILFVIDDSKSMKAHQTKLSKSVKSFVNKLATVKKIDYHIGYTLSWDRTRYGSVVPEVCPDGKRNWQPAGSLEPLLGPAELLPKDGRRFVTRDDAGHLDVLKSSLDPETNVSLVKDLINPGNDKGLCPTGPLEEEMFTPVLGALDDPTRAVGPNAGFRRPDAFFVVIILSDAKDASGMSPDDVVKRLEASTKTYSAGPKGFRVFSVVMKPGKKFVESCVPDNAFGDMVRVHGRDVYQIPYGRTIEANPLASLAQLTEDAGSSRVDQGISICDSDFGDTLGDYGTQVQQDVLVDVRIGLGGKYQVFPTGDKRNLNVFVDGYELNPAQWSVDDASDTVTVFGKKIDWDKFPEGKIKVKVVPVDAEAPTSRPAGH
ncbi:MAG TPA: hypothetical protein PKC28_01990 [Bdellovibrionales bacterium]|nr:hypothetical protein [Bdellovibrionales bacterium]